MPRVLGVLAVVLSARAATSSSLPEQIHISLAGGDGIASGGSSTGMRVNWYTEDNVGKPLLLGPRRQPDHSASEEELAA